MKNSEPNRGPDTSDGDRRISPLPQTPSPCVVVDVDELCQLDDINHLQLQHHQQNLFGYLSLTWSYHRPGRTLRVLKTRHGAAAAIQIMHDATQELEDIREKYAFDDALLDANINDRGRFANHTISETEADYVDAEGNVTELPPAEDSDQVWRPA